MTSRSRGLALNRWLAAEYSVPALAATLALVLRVVGLTRQSLWTDELYVAWEARQPLDVLFNPRIHIQHPPGYRLAMHVWMGLGTGEFWIRLLPAICGVALVGVVWALARALWPGHPWAAGAAAFMAATSPYMVHYGQDITAYSWTALWVALSMLLLVYAWRDDRAWLWAAWGVSLAVALYSHYFAAFPLLVEIAAIVVTALFSRLRQRRAEPATEMPSASVRPRVAHAALAVLGAALLYTPWVVVLLTQSGDALGQVLYPPTVDNQPVGWLPVLVAGYPHGSFWQSGAGQALVWGLLLGALGWGVLRLAMSRSWRDAAGVALTLGWGLAGVVGPYLFLRVTTPPDAVTPVRFAALAVPALLVGLGALVGSVPTPARVLLLGAWAALVIVQLYGHYEAPPTQDWRGVMTTVARGARPGDAFLAFPAFHAGAAASFYNVPPQVQGGWFLSEGRKLGAMAYWFPVGWSWRGFLSPVAYKSADFPGEIAKRTTGATRLWYLAGDNTDGTYPPSQSAEQALASEGWQLEEEWHTSPLVLRLYTRNR